MGCRNAYLKSSVQRELVSWLSGDDDLVGPTACMFYAALRCPEPQEAPTGIPLSLFDYRGLDGRWANFTEADDLQLEETRMSRLGMVKVMYQGFGQESAAFWKIVQIKNETFVVIRHRSDPRGTSLVNAHDEFVRIAFEIATTYCPAIAASDVNFGLLTPDSMEVYQLITELREAPRRWYERRSTAPSTLVPTDLIRSGCTVGEEFRQSMSALGLQHERM